MQQFASDNCAGICPEALQALLAANAGDAPGYGEDDWTRRVSDRLRALFETDCDVYFVFNGTAANSLALASLIAFAGILLGTAAGLRGALRVRPLPTA